MAHIKKNEFFFHKEWVGHKRHIGNHLQTHG